MTYKEAAREILTATEAYLNPKIGWTTETGRGGHGIDEYNRKREQAVERVAGVLEKLDFTSKSTP